MPKNAVGKSYSEKARLLRSFGFPIKYGLKGKTGAAQKAAVTRTWAKIAGYIENEKQQFTFQKSKGEELKEVSEGLTRNQITPGGFFLRRAKGSRGKTSLRKVGDKKLRFTSSGPKGGRIVETIYRIDWRLLMEDPPKAILALGKPGDKVILTVNGYDSSQTLDFSLESLAYYMALDLLPKFLDPNLDPAYTRAHGAQKGRKRQKLERFCDIFHVKVIRYIRAKKGKTKKKTAHVQKKRKAKRRGR